MQDLIRAKIREIPDWPQKGVNFKDITPLLQDHELFCKTIDFMASRYLGAPIDKIIGIDARGFIFASALAYKLGTGLAIVRKKGKLPGQTISKEYSLEYGSNILEMHNDAILPGERVLLVDDVLATGGTIGATAELVKQLRGEIIGIEFLLELSFLHGREKLKEYNINSILQYEAEASLKIGIIGGTGFYDFFGETAEAINVETDFGKPSDVIIKGKISANEVYFLPRHGKNHVFPPHRIPYRANIAALKKLGVDIIIAPSAVGSLKPEIKPGDFVICDQYINRTAKRADTFFEGPEVAHIESAYPYCLGLRELAVEQGRRLGLPLHEKGTAVVIEGPRFSTLAESKIFSQTADVINMTQYPEVVLAAEAGICYLNISLVTDYDAGIYADGGAKPVSIDQVMVNFKNNNEKLKKFIAAIIENIHKKGECDCKKKSESAKI